MVGGWEEDVGVCCGDSDDGAGMDDGDVPTDDEIVIGEFGRPPVVDMHALSVITERAINPIATTVQPGRAMPIRPVPARSRTVHRPSCSPRSQMTSPAVRIACIRRSLAVIDPFPKSNLTSPWRRLPRGKSPRSSAE